MIALLPALLKGTALSLQFSRLFRMIMHLPVQLRDLLLGQVCQCIVKHFYLPIQLEGKVPPRLFLLL